MRVPLGTVVREWGRIGLIGFGGPPAHVALLRELTSSAAAGSRRASSRTPTPRVSCCPGRARRSSRSTARSGSAGCPARSRRPRVHPPGLLIVLAIAALALGDAPPAWIIGIGAGAGAAGSRSSRRRGSPSAAARSPAARDVRAPLYLARRLRRGRAGRRARRARAVAAGLLELAWRRRGRAALHAWPVALAPAPRRSAAWPGPRSRSARCRYGGGFVIIPLMQEDAVDRHGWMTQAEFFNAVAFGQLTPGPVAHTVALVG